MDFGSIIKRSWQITWRYKAMWILGIFAGISGCQPGGGGGSGGGGTSGREFDSMVSDLGLPSGGTPSYPGAFFEQFASWLPAIIAAIGVLVLVGILWSILSVAARGGLVAGVDAAENGVKMRAGDMWGAGFNRFWSLVGVDIMLVLPIVFVSLLMAVVIIVPIMGAAAGGSDNIGAALVPVCGALGLGIPLLIVMGFILGIMHPIAVRYVMLGGQGAGASVANSWRFLRARVKDSVVMWLLSGALNLGASFVLAIPVVVIAIALGVGIGGAAFAEQVGLAIALGGVLVFAVIVLGVLYSAVWGTFTSALWTLFFREVTGMATPALQVRPDLQPDVPGAPAPPVAPTAPPPPAAPPMAPYGEQPGA